MWFLCQIWFMYFLLPSDVLAAENECQIQYNNCFRTFEEFETKAVMKMVVSEDDLDIACKLLKSSLDCLERYAVFCLKNHSNQNVFYSLGNSTKTIMYNLCQPSSFRTEYLRHSSCLTATMSDHSLCKERFVNSLVGKRHAVDQKDICSSYLLYGDCVKKMALQECGKDALDLVSEYMSISEEALYKTYCPAIVQSSVKEHNGQTVKIEENMQSGILPLYLQNIQRIFVSFMLLLLIASNLMFVI